MTLNYENNWMHHHYTVNGKVVIPKVVDIYKEGKFFGKFEVVKENESGTYPDMGHTYSYSTVQYYVHLDSVFGKIKGPSLSYLIKDGYSIDVMKCK